METRKLIIQGIADQNDVDQIRHALHEVWGVQKVEISKNSGEITFTYDENAASYHDFKQAILESGFKIGDEMESNS